MANSLSRVFLASPATRGVTLECGVQMLNSFLLSLPASVPSRLVPVNDARAAGLQRQDAAQEVPPAAFAQRRQGRTGAKALQASSRTVSAAGKAGRVLLPAAARA